MSGDSPFREAEELLQKFYDALQDRYGFHVADEMRSPGNQVPEELREEGYIPGLERGGVEVIGLPFPYGLRVDVCIPVLAEPDELFRRVACKRKEYLQAKEKLVANKENLEFVLRRVDELTNHGAEIYRSNQKRLI